MHGPVNLVLRHQLTCHNVALSNPLIGKCFVFILVLVWNFVPCRMLLIVVSSFFASLFSKSNLRLIYLLDEGTVDCFFTCVDTSCEELKGERDELNYPT